VYSEVPMMARILLGLPAAGAIALALVGCSADSEFKMSADEGAYYDTGAGDAAGGDGGGAPNDDDGDIGGEVEDDFLRLLPAATDRYVFVANPTRDTVTRISVDTLEVITVGVGNNPAVVVTTPDYTRAVTFNQDSDDVSIIDSSTLAVVEVPVRENFNNMVMSPDGRWVICYHDQAIEEETSGSGGVSSFNEISLVDTQNEVHWPQVVGFQPNQVQYSADSGLAVVVSDENLAVIDLTAEAPSPVLVQIAEDLGDPPAAEEVVVTPDGGFALVRQYGVDNLVVVNLATLEVSRIPAGSNPTDLDLDPTGELAVVVARDSQELYVYEVADLVSAASFAPERGDTGDTGVDDGPPGPGGLDTGDTGGGDSGEPDSGPVAQVYSLPADEIIGSLLFAPSGDKAILYTTAAREARYHVWDLASGDIDVHLLEKPIRSMGISPTGDSMLVFHTLEDADEADPTSPFYGEEALTIIDLDDFRSNPLLLDAPPAAYANSNDGEWGYFIMEDQPSLIAIDYSTLLYTPVTLYSAAVHVGVLPDSPYAYVNQEHDLGRISFYTPSEVDGGVLETITGFELNAGIEH
jgi:DNA-binding beta-propeller fold protein YncE